MSFVLSLFASIAVQKNIRDSGGFETPNMFAKSFRDTFMGDSKSSDAEEKR